MLNPEDSHRNQGHVRASRLMPVTPPFPERPLVAGRLERMSTTGSDLPEVVRIARDLIRFDTTNWGGGKAERRARGRGVRRRVPRGTGPGARVLRADPAPHERDGARAPGATRASPRWSCTAISTWCPQSPEDWSVDPFAGEIRDGMLWGRGAVDMKDMDAMILTSVADILRAGEQPERDLILAFFADEENGGVEGSAARRRESPGVVRRARPKRSARSAGTRSRSATAAPTCCRWARRH